jgi:hypothetical protein
MIGWCWSLFGTTTPLEKEEAYYGHTTPNEQTALT